MRAGQRRHRPRRHAQPAPHAGQRMREPDDARADHHQVEGSHACSIAARAMTTFQLLDFAGVGVFAVVMLGRLGNPLAPLVAGLVDELAAAGVAAFGPTKDAARIEGSKAYAKQLMKETGVPTAAHVLFRTREEAAELHARQSITPAQHGRC